MGDLKWPPDEIDLRRLYCDRRLSAAKIAAEYGLKYPNPKSGETLVLYHLKRFGIARRDRAEHIRKVSPTMVDEWVRRYEAGESLRQIAGAEVNAETVWDHLRRRGVRLRNKVDAQIAAVTKYSRHPFVGSRLDKAYMIGLRYGDLSAVRHGRAVRVRLSTTHPAMGDLFEQLFSPYGHVSKYPRAAKLVGYEWSLECDLDTSFEFLLNKVDPSKLKPLLRNEFLSFLAGIFDAEGSVVLHRKRARHDPEVYLTNGDVELLDCVSTKLGQLGYHALVRWRRQPTNRGGVVGHSKIGRVEILRFREAQRLLRALPIKHAEKRAKRRLALELDYRMRGEGAIRIPQEWRALTGEIRKRTAEFIALARAEVEKRGQN